MIDAILHDTEMKLIRSDVLGDRYVTTLPYEVLDPYKLAEFWVNDPGENLCMVEAKSESMGPHFLKLAKEDIILILLAAQERGWFEDV